MAEEERERAVAQEQHDHDMAILAARRLESVAQANLEAIERSICQEESQSRARKNNEKTSTTSSKRAEAWVRTQPFYEATPKGINREYLGCPSILNEGEELPMYEAQQPSTMAKQCMGALVTTNERLTASLTKLTLPKCHPDILSGDATMFHPWRAAFKGMIQGSDITPENKLNYLCSYTAGDPRKLVDSYRKRRHVNLEVVLKELWLELERRFGNVAIITNAFLTKLRESAKFTESDKKKLQAFADLCADVASQVNQLPGLTCLNYPNALRPILYNLSDPICNKWNKQVVTYTQKNNDGYPNFAMFASMIQEQSILKNHPYVTVIEKQGRTERRKSLVPPADPGHTVLKAGAITEEHATQTEEKHCIFHKCNGHNVSECEVFAQKNLDEKTLWIKEQRLCFRCLLPNHVARQCKVKVKCETCGSDHHSVLLHKEKKREQRPEDGEEVSVARSSVNFHAAGRVSCSKIALVDVFHPNRPQKVIRAYALVDEQSNVSMISPELANDLGMFGRREKYLLSNCSRSKEVKFGRRIQGLMVKSMSGKVLSLPTLIECREILKTRVRFRPQSWRDSTLTCET